jgi:predicted nucleic acid-binding protein
VYCFDTDILSATMRRDPPLSLVRRLATIPARDQHTTAITAAELLYGAARQPRPGLVARVNALLTEAIHILPFDADAAYIHGPLRAQLERDGHLVAEPDLRIASIALAHDLTLVTANLRHFRLVPGLRLENWLSS